MQYQEGLEKRKNIPYSKNLLSSLQEQNLTEDERTILQIITSIKETYSICGEKQIKEIYRLFHRLSLGDLEEITSQIEEFDHPQQLIFELY